MRFRPFLALLGCAGVGLTGGAALPPPVAPAPTNWPIIVRRGDALFEGDRPFRFFGLAAPNLHQNESELFPDHRNRFPDEFEIRDVLRSFQQLGARATRCFVLSVAAPTDRGLPVYITGRRTYSEEAFRTLDQVLALCPEYDVRVIIPLVASQHFEGWQGMDAFAALAGKTGSVFWTDPEVRADYRALVDYLVNRRNTVTGRLYRDDPAILAWQLGNELGSWFWDRKLPEAEWMPRLTAWSVEMAAYIKKADPNHLVMEAGGDRATFIADPNLDVMSTHLYEYWNRLGGQPWDLAPLARIDRETCRGKKPLIIDEFGLGGIDNLRRLMAEIREDGITGGLLWGIRGHRRDGGFYYHNEGGTPINSYHWPGFAAGEAYDERRLLDLLRSEAFAIRGAVPPPVPPPSPAPVLFRLGNGLTWRGSTGAATYTLERAEHVEGPWTVLAVGLSDSVALDVKTLEDSKVAEPTVLFVDATAPRGTPLFYRVKGVNAAGETPYSEPVALTRP